MFITKDARNLFNAINSLDVPLYGTYYFLSTFGPTRGDISQMSAVKATAYQSGIIGQVEWELLYRLLEQDLLEEENKMFAELLRKSSDEFNLSLLSEFCAYEAWRLLVPKSKMDTCSEYVEENIITKSIVVWDTDLIDDLYIIPLDVSNFCGFVVYNDGIIYEQIHVCSEFLLTACRPFNFYLSFIYRLVCGEDDL